MTDQKRRQTAPKLLRMRPEERAFLDAATAKVTETLRRQHQTVSYGLSNFILNAALGEAARVLDTDLATWTADQQKPSKRKAAR